MSLHHVAPFIQRPLPARGSLPKEPRPLLLQAKGADRSVLASYAGTSACDNQGQRVVAGQRLMRAAGDIFLGRECLTDIDGRQRDPYVRQLRHGEASPNPNSCMVSRLALAAINGHGTADAAPVARHDVRIGVLVDFLAGRWRSPDAVSRQLVTALGTWRHESQWLETELHRLLDGDG